MVDGTQSCCPNIGVARISDELHALLDRYCDPGMKKLTPLTCQITVGLETPAAVRNKGMDVPS